MEEEDLDNGEDDGEGIEQPIRGLFSSPTFVSNNSDHDYSTNSADRAATNSTKETEIDDKPSKRRKDDGSLGSGEEGSGKKKKPKPSNDESSAAANTTKTEAILARVEYLHQRFPGCDGVESGSWYLRLEKSKNFDEETERIEREFGGGGGKSTTMKTAVSKNGKKDDGGGGSKKPRTVAERREREAKEQEEKERHAREQADRLCNVFPRANLYDTYRRIFRASNANKEVQRIFAELNAQAEEDDVVEDVNRGIERNKLTFEMLFPSTDQGEEHGRDISAERPVLPQQTDSITGDILWIQVQSLIDRYPGGDPNAWYARLERADDIHAETERIRLELENGGGETTGAGAGGEVVDDAIIETILADMDGEIKQDIPLVLEAVKHIRTLLPHAQFETCFRRLAQHDGLIDEEVGNIMVEFAIPSQQQATSTAGRMELGDGEGDRAGPSTAPKPSRNDSSTTMAAEGVEEFAEFMSNEQFAQVEQITQMFPDCDRLHVMKELVENGVQAEYLIEKMTRGAYPKWKDRRAKEKLEKRRREFMDPTRFDVEEFLKIFPEPETFFTNADRSVSELYRHHALTQLQNEFPQIDLAHLRQRLEDNNNHFLPAARMVREDMRTNPMNVNTGRKRTKAKVQKVPYLTHPRDAPVPYPDELDELFYRELQYSMYQERIREFLETRLETRARRVRELRARNVLHECGICYADDVLPEEHIGCSNRGSTHKYCRDCVQKHAEEIIGQGRHLVTCLSDDCGEAIPLATLQRVLQPRLIDLILRRSQQEEIRAAGVENMETCPFCDFAVIMDAPADDDRVLKCQNPDCLKQSCRLCKEVNHVPLKCNEVEKPDETRMRTFVENRMAEALIRTCPKCNSRTIKEDGCNKMACSCGAYFCYVCRTQLDKKNPYAHFHGHSGGEKSSCQLHTSIQEVHAKIAEQAGEKARAEYLEKHPDYEASGKKSVVVKDLVDEVTAEHRGRMGRGAMEFLGRMDAEMGAAFRRHQMAMDAHILLHDYDVPIRAMPRRGMLEEAGMGARILAHEEPFRELDLDDDGGGRGLGIRGALMREGGRGRRPEPGDGAMAVRFFGGALPPTAAAVRAARTAAAAIGTDGGGGGEAKSGIGATGRARKTVTGRRSAVTFRSASSSSTSSDDAEVILGNISSDEEDRQSPPMAGFRRTRDLSADDLRRIRRQAALRGDEDSDDDVVNYAAGVVRQRNRTAAEQHQEQLLRQRQRQGMEPEVEHHRDLMRRYYEPYQQQQQRQREQEREALQEQRRRQLEQKRREELQRQNQERRRLEQLQQEDQQRKNQEQQRQAQIAREEKRIEDLRRTIRFYDERKRTADTDEERNRADAHRIRCDMEKNQAVHRLTRLQQRASVDERTRRDQERERERRAQRERIEVEQRRRQEEEQERMRQVQRRRVLASAEAHRERRNVNQQLRVQEPERIDQQDEDQQRRMDEVLREELAQHEAIDPWIDQLHYERRQEEMEREMALQREQEAEGLDALYHDPWPVAEAPIRGFVTDQEQADDDIINDAIEEILDDSRRIVAAAKLNNKKDGETSGQSKKMDRTAAAAAGPSNSGEADLIVLDDDDDDDGPAVQCFTLSPIGSFRRLVSPSIVDQSSASDQSMDRPHGAEAMGRVADLLVRAIDTLTPAQLSASFDRATDGQSIDRGTTTAQDQSADGVSTDQSTSRGHAFSIADQNQPMDQQGTSSSSHVRSISIDADKESDRQQYQPSTKPKYPDPESPIDDGEASSVVIEMEPEDAPDQHRRRVESDLVSLKTSVEQLNLRLIAAHRALNRGAGSKAAVHELMRARDATLARMMETRDAALKCGLDPDTIGGGEEIGEGDGDVVGVLSKAEIRESILEVESRMLEKKEREKDDGTSATKEEREKENTLERVLISINYHEQILLNPRITEDQLRDTLANVRETVLVPMTQMEPQNDMIEYAANAFEEVHRTMENRSRGGGAGAAGGLFADVVPVREHANELRGALQAVQGETRRILDERRTSERRGGRTGAGAGATGGAGASAAKTTTTEAKTRHGPTNVVLARTAEEQLMAERLVAQMTAAVTEAATGARAAGEGTTTGPPLHLFQRMNQMGAIGAQGYAQWGQFGLGPMAAMGQYNPPPWIAPYGTRPPMAPTPLQVRPPPPGPGPRGAGVKWELKKFYDRSPNKGEEKDKSAPPNTVAQRQRCQQLAEHRRRLVEIDEEIARAERESIRLENELRRNRQRVVDLRAEREIMQELSTEAFRRLQRGEAVGEAGAGAGVKKEAVGGNNEGGGDTSRTGATKTAAAKVRATPREPEVITLASDEESKAIAERTADWVLRPFTSDQQRRYPSVADRITTVPMRRPSASVMQQQPNRQTSAPVSSSPAASADQAGASRSAAGRVLSTPSSPGGNFVQINVNVQPSAQFELHLAQQQRQGGAGAGTEAQQPPPRNNDQQQEAERFDKDDDDDEEGINWW